MKNKKLEGNIIIAINAMKKIMVLFLGPFLTAYFIKTSQESIVDLSIYYIFSYILLAIGSFIVASIIKNKFRIGMFRIGVILNLDGITAGAAVIGCCCQMVGFAVASYRENKFGGLLAQGIGTSMLQIPNIVRKPVIWLPAIISSAILGPVSSVVFKMTNNATGSGMGSAGFVGQIMAYETMISSSSSKVVILQIALMHFILPALLTLLISEFMRKKEWIKQGDMALDI